MKSIGIGVIGCGARVTFLLKLLQQQSKDVRIAAVCDPSADAVRNFREQFNPQARAYSDYRELVRDPAVEWVIVGSWNCYHAEHSVAALQAGKHVFCEKPLATTLEDCVRIRDAWRQSGRMFFIGFVLRYSAHYRRIKSLIDEGAIGQIISMEFNETLDFNHGGYIHADWRRLVKNAGSHMLEKCCHDMDLVNWIVGSVPRRAASFGGTNFFTPENARHMDRIGRDDKGRRAYCTWRSGNGDPFTADKDIIDNQVAILEFENSVRVSFHANCNSGLPERRMYICGTEGAIRGDVYAGKIELRRIGFNTTVQDCAAGVHGSHGGADAPIMTELLASMFQDKTPPTSIEEGLKSAIACFGIDEAHASGRVVDLAPMWAKAGICSEEAVLAGR
ncbi:MAG TPA: Gfo/Idh/MocA family oxidoreductase [Planctomycetota bacterium]|nr:Gfo/Idh/MocA family oxidoreductase [Planctomycetota bacterium]